MIKRIVKLTFKTSEIETFKAIFEEKKEKIRGFAGCEHLELWQDIDHQNVFFTYSFWQDASYLEKYRHSDFFKSTWKETKVLFDGKPIAWSVAEIK